MSKYVKIIALFLVFCLLAGCGNKENSESTENISDTASSSSSADYDLTEMNSDMVYATVYQLMSDPDQYVGKTFRMEGTYYANYYEATDQYYHCCIVADATSCCAQGLEFVWGDGTHVYPDEYPQDDTEIIVEGTLETYDEDGIQYVHLVDASLEIV